MNKPFHPRGALPRTAYEADLHGWALEQAALLRAGRVVELDLPNIAEEVDDVAAAQYDKLESALRVLLMHMLKWDYQPERRSRSWANTIAEQRARIVRVLRKNPSLKSKLEEARDEAWTDARRAASSETDLPLRSFPSALPYGWAEITERAFDYDPPEG